jgi:hypothetical protein
MKKSIPLAALVLFGALQIGTPMDAVADDASYGYCVARLGQAGNLEVVVSTTYRINGNVYSVGVQNSFRSYVDANFSRRSDTPICQTTIGSWQEAEDDRNDAIADYRRDGWSVHTVRWAYHGD